MKNLTREQIELFNDNFHIERHFTQKQNFLLEFKQTILQDIADLKVIEAYWFSDSDKISTQDLDFRYQIFTKSGHLVADNLKTTKEVKDFILSPKII